MNVDEVLESTRPAERPAADVAARHRAQVRARMAASERPVVGAPRSGDQIDLDVWTAGARRRRWPAAAAVIVLVLAAAGGLVARSVRHSPHVGVDPSGPAATQNSTTNSTLPTTIPATSAPATTPTLPQAEPVDSATFASLVGPVDIELHEASVDVPIDATTVWRWRMTSTELCTEVVADGDVVTQTECGAPPVGLTMWGEWQTRDRLDEPVSATHTLRLVTAAGVDLRLLTDDGRPAACMLDGLAAPQIGPIVLWVCRADGDPAPWQLEADVDGRTIVTDVIVPGLAPGNDPLPAIGDRIPVDEGLFPHWFTSWAGPSAAPGTLFSVGRDGFVIGYTTIVPPSVPGETTAGDGWIVDADGVVIGQFVDDGTPVLFDDEPSEHVSVDEAGLRLPSTGLADASVAAAVEVGVVEGWRITIDPPGETMPDAIACLTVEERDGSVGRLCPTAASPQGLLSSSVSSPGGTSLMLLVTANTVTATATSTRCDLHPIDLGAVVPAVLWWCAGNDANPILDATFVLPDGSRLRIGS